MSVSDSSPSDGPTNPDHLQRVAIDQWLNVVQREYLGSLIRSGGSTVKFISGEQAILQTATDQLAEMAREGGYWYAFLDCDQVIEPIDPLGKPKKPDFHKIDRFFFGVTKEVDWPAWAEKHARTALHDAGLDLGTGRFPGVAEIAARNGMDEPHVKRIFERSFAAPQMGDHGMTIEFRSAILQLGSALVMPVVTTPTTEEVLLGWFRGQPALPGGANSLKRIGIYERINQSNARYMLASFCRWLPNAGYSGLVVVLDFRPYQRRRVSVAQHRREQLERLQQAIEAGASSEELREFIAPAQAEEGNYYGDKPYLQMLELLRHFLDETGENERFFLVTLTDDSYYDRRNPRNYQNYEALQARIEHEARDLKFANASEALVHLEAGI